MDVFRFKNKGLQWKYAVSLQIVASNKSQRDFNQQTDSQVTSIYSY